MVVEDEQDLADLFAAWLTPMYEVRTAYDGETAVDQLDSEIDCVLLDRRMPGLSGDDVLSAIRSNGLECPVAMVTAVEPDFDIVEMGFDDYIVKPVSKSELLSVIENLFSLESYDDLIQEYYRLSAKKAALETNKTDDELTQSEEYQHLLARFQEAKSDADKQLANIGERGDSAQLFR